MSKRMLIDANHPEETRVVVLDGSKVEEFDFEAASKRPLKGNIYLAKVTRVEPSLQAAFVEYGGNRQGFLAFSEIHPDYYQIPIADREALLAEQEAEARRRQEDDIESFEIGGKPEGEEEEEPSGPSWTRKTKNPPRPGTIIRKKIATRFLSIMAASRGTISSITRIGMTSPSANPKPRMKTHPITATMPM